MIAQPSAQLAERAVPIAAAQEELGGIDGTRADEAVTRGDVAVLFIVRVILEAHLVTA